MRRFLEYTGINDRIQRFGTTVVASPTPSTNEPLLRSLASALRVVGRTIYSDYTEIQRYRTEQSKYKNYQLRSSETKGAVEVGGAEGLTAEANVTLFPGGQKGPRIPKLPATRWFALLNPLNIPLLLLRSFRVTVNTLADRIENPTARTATKAVLGFLPFVGEMILYPVTEMPTRIAFEYNKAKEAKQATGQESQAIELENFNEEEVESEFVDKPEIDSVLDWGVPADTSSVKVGHAGEKDDYSHVEAAEIHRIRQASDAPPLPPKRGSVPTSVQAMIRPPMPKQMPVPLEQVAMQSIAKTIEPFGSKQSDWLINLRKDIKIVVDRFPRNDISKRADLSAEQQKALLMVHDLHDLLKGAARFKNVPGISGIKHAQVLKQFEKMNDASVKEVLQNFAMTPVAAPKNQQAR